MGTENKKTYLDRGAHIYTQWDCDDYKNYPDKMDDWQEQKMQGVPERIDRCDEETEDQAEKDHERSDQVGKSCYREVQVLVYFRRSTEMRAIESAGRHCKVDEIDRPSKDYEKSNGGYTMIWALRAVDFF